MLVNPDDFRAVAKRRLPSVVFDYVDSGAGAEGTTRANEEAFHAIKFRPRHMVDVSERSQRVTVLGRTIEMPVLIGPAGPARMLHKDGDIALARAAKAMGTIHTLGTGASSSIEEVAEASAGGTLWYQVYMWRSRELIRSLVERADRAGYHAIVLTIDTATAARRDRDLRNGLLSSGRPPQVYRNQAKLSILPALTPRVVLDVLRHPGWLLGTYLLTPPITFKNVTEEDARMAATSWYNPGTLIQKRMSETATWDEVRFLRSIWQGPLVVKGVMTSDDAAEAFDHGADAVIVSNHGGRHMDGLPATIDVLPRIVEVGARKRKEVLIDGGIRRGIDVIRALALGARACLVVRPAYWGLVVDGERGVRAVLDNLRKEVDSGLGALGRPRLEDLDRSCLDLTVAPWHRDEGATKSSGT